MPSKTQDIDEQTLLSPFEIWEIPLGGVVIKFRKPLILHPVWLSDDPNDHDENEYLAVDVPKLRLSAWGRNREELWEAIRENIRETWRMIVRVPDHRISAKGKKVKDAFLMIAEEVIDG